MAYGIVDLYGEGVPGLLHSDAKKGTDPFYLSIYLLLFYLLLKFFWPGIADNKLG